MSDERRAKIVKVNEELAAQALRTLGVAARELPADALEHEEVDERLEHELIFLGLIGMIDPPREEAKEAVARAKRAGIRPIMITGDHPKTAAVIAAELGITSNGRAVTGAELEKQSDEALVETVREVSVYARVNPEHKLRIVKALQTGGATVAMTGDGVNDAPALRTADIGVAMGITGTDVSKEAADVVLIDDNFATIVAAVEEGRAIFANIRKFLRYLLSSNIGEVMTMFFGVVLAKLIGLYSEGEAVVLPLLATQILWINLVTDGLPALALGVDPADSRCHESPAAPSQRRHRHAPHVGGNPVRRRHHGDRHAAHSRRLPARRPDRRRGGLALRPDDGFHHADDVSDLQRVQRPLRRTKRVSWVLSESLAMGRDRFVAGTAGGRRLCALPAERLLDDGSKLRRLAALRGGRQLGVVVRSRIEQMDHPIQGWEGARERAGRHAPAPQDTTEYTKR